MGRVSKELKIFYDSIKGEGPIRKVEQSRLNYNVNTSQKHESSRTSRFIEHLYQEKEFHKEHRHKHVIYKLVLSTTFFGLGHIKGNAQLFQLFLYVVPFIALVHDVYIFAEHFKVHRVGLFIRRLGSEPDIPVCKEELDWEEYVKEHREKYAVVASLAYTVCITVFSAAAIYLSGFDDTTITKEYFVLWSGVVFSCIAMVFVFAWYLRIKINKMNRKLLNYPAIRP